MHAWILHPAIQESRFDQIESQAATSSEPPPLQNPPNRNEVKIFMKLNIQIYMFPPFSKKLQKAPKVKVNKQTHHNWWSRKGKTICFVISLKRKILMKFDYEFLYPIIFTRYGPTQEGLYRRRLDIWSQSKQKNLWNP